MEKRIKQEVLSSFRIAKYFTELHDVVFIVGRRHQLNSVEKAQQLLRNGFDEHLNRIEPVGLTDQERINIRNMIEVLRRPWSAESKKKQEELKHILSEDVKKRLKNLEESLEKLFPLLSTDADHKAVDVYVKHSKQYFYKPFRERRSVEFFRSRGKEVGEVIDRTCLDPPEEPLEDPPLPQALATGTPASPELATNRVVNDVGDGTNGMEGSGANFAFPPYGNYNGNVSEAGLKMAVDQLLQTYKQNAAGEASNGSATFQKNDVKARKVLRSFRLVDIFEPHELSSPHSGMISSNSTDSNLQKEEREKATCVSTHVAADLNTVPSILELAVKALDGQNQGYIQWSRQKEEAFRLGQQKVHNIQTAPGFNPENQIARKRGLEKEVSSEAGSLPPMKKLEQCVLAVPNNSFGNSLQTLIPFSFQSNTLNSEGVRGVAEVGQGEGKNQVSLTGTSFPVAQVTIPTVLAPGQDINGQVAQIPQQSGNNDMRWENHDGAVDQLRYVDRQRYASGLKNNKTQTPADPVRLQVPEPTRIGLQTADIGRSASPFRPSTPRLPLNGGLSSPAMIGAQLPAAEPIRSHIPVSAVEPALVGNVLTASSQMKPRDGAPPQQVQDIWNVLFSNLRS